MNKKMLAMVVALSCLAGSAFAGKVKDWKDLHKARVHLQQVVAELGRARAANHYDMAGHGAKAEELVKQAERELGLAEEAARGEK